MDQVLKLVPGFHVLTGSDTTSYLAGHTEKTCWAVFKEHHHLLQGLGDGPTLYAEAVHNAKQFVCSVHGSVAANSIDEVRSNLFVKGLSMDQLTPTQDALLCHIRRSHYQAGGKLTCSIQSCHHQRQWVGKWKGRPITTS